MRDLVKYLAYTPVEVVGLRECDVKRIHPLHVHTRELSQGLVWQFKQKHGRN